MPGKFDERFAAAQAEIEEARTRTGERAEKAWASRTPEAREQILRKAHELVNESRRTHEYLPIGHEHVLATARFLAGE